MMQNKRILVVDDDPPSRTLMQELLEVRGYSVAAAGTEQDALQMFDAAAERFDLLITDIVLPGEQRGYQLAWRLVQRDPLLRVLLVSAYASAHDEFDSAVATTRRAFLEKPLDPGVFLNTVAALLA